MSDQYINEPLLDMFLFETSQLIEQLEQSILSSEKESCFTQDAINEIFRIMHTIKGSSAMMMFHDISGLAHSLEDLFYYLREEQPDKIDCSDLSDLVLDVVDFIKVEVEKIKNGYNADGIATSFIETMKDYLSLLKENNNCNASTQESEKVDTNKQSYISEKEVDNNELSYTNQKEDTSKLYHKAYKALIYFEDGCEMENIRAFTVIRNLKSITDQVFYIPGDIIDNDDSIEIIRKNGFLIYLKSNYNYQKMYEFFMKTIFLKDLELIQLDNEEEFKQFNENSEEILQENSSTTQDIVEPQKNVKEQVAKEIKSSSAAQSIISVSVTKLDKLMDLVGEMVIAEAMVIQNPDLQGLELDNFQKAARQLNKITTEMQDMVMSIRMVPLSATFNKMHRIVRDMSKKLDKEIHLEILGEETEVDKNIIEHISDPLMHLVRNSIDHGIESSNLRLSKGKSKLGTVTLEAKNSGSDVLIIVKDDGCGLDREKILKKARENDLLIKNENDMTDKEVFNLILLPGFSTKQEVTEFSGRGVGMDVVTKNIEAVGGSLSVDSMINKGTQITLKIPLTLAIIDGMNIKVGNSCYTIPIISIKESFRPKESDIFTDTDNNEMIMVRGQCYKILRLHEAYKVKTDVTNFAEGIIIMVEQADKTFCIFADELLGQQQVVVKALPEYIRGFKTNQGLGGCTLLGDGSISLILDIAGLISM